jgi:hypothetical protein
MLKSKALFYAIFVTVILNIILGSVIMLVYYSNYYINRYEKIYSLQTGLHSALELYLNGNYQEKRKDYIAEMAGIPDDFLEISTGAFGIYDITTIEAGFSGKTYSKTAITGQSTTYDKQMALWVSDMENFLTISGNSRIYGRCYLPEKGIKTGTIGGQSFSGDISQMNIKISSRKLPAVNTGFAESIRKTIVSSNNQKDNLSFRYDSIFNSFTNEALIINGGRTTVPENCSFRGHVVIHATKKISLSAGNELEDVIIFAPVIEIKSGFRGNLQIFATDSVIMQPDANLDYPSSIILLSEQGVSGNCIELKSRSSITGTVAYLNPIITDTREKNLIIHENAVITGSAYIQGNTANYGEIYGCLMTRRCIVKTDRGIYPDYIYNGIFDATLLPAKYVNCNLFREYLQKKIVKWVG